MKQIIWTSDVFFDADARMQYEEYQRMSLGDNEYKVSDEEWSEAVNEALNDERCNLNREVNGIIVAFADLGLWDGRKQGYLLIGRNIGNILHSSYDAEWYGDTYNIRGIERHHDGTNYILYRVAKDEETALRIAGKIYNGDIDDVKFRKMTHSLYPYVAKIYGWKLRMKASKHACRLY